MDDREPWMLPKTQDHIQRMLDSYRHWTGAELIERDGTALEQARRLFYAPRVVVSHGTQLDPILSFGNQAALHLWEMDFTSFTQTPSRLTAEPMHRAERASLLERTARNGFADDYQGIRISRSGKRFRIEQAVIWNLIDERQQRIGQAATFARWIPLEA